MFYYRRDGLVQIKKKKTLPLIDQKQEEAKKNRAKIKQMRSKKFIKLHKRRERIDWEAL